MNFYLTGIDYKTADISSREAILRRKNEIAQFLSGKFQEFSLLITCNRFEIYAIGDNQLTESFFSEGKYFLSGKIEILRHCLRLACGLESELKGEFQILQQIDEWQRNLPLGLNKFWQEAYLKAKDIRDIAGLNDPAHNVANAVYEEVIKITGKENPRGIIIGTGKIAELFSIYKPEFVDLSFASHRNIERAKVLAQKSAGSVLPLEQIRDCLVSADFVVSATKSPHFILKQEDIRQIYEMRKEPLYIYDLAIPRDVEPAVKDLPLIVLKNLDDLSINFERFNLRINEKLNLANYLIEEEINDYTLRHSRKQSGLKAGR